MSVLEHFCSLVHEDVRPGLVAVLSEVKRSLYSQYFTPKVSGSRAKKEKPEGESVALQQVPYFTAVKNLRDELQGMEKELDEAKAQLSSKSGALVLAEARLRDAERSVARVMHAELARTMVCSNLKLSHKLNSRMRIQPRCCCGQGEIRVQGTAEQNAASA